MLLDASLTVLHNGCAFKYMCITWAARMGALKNSTPPRIEPAPKAAFKAFAETEHRSVAKKKGTR
jgi:hypothetical protein